MNNGTNTLFRTVISLLLFITLCFADNPIIQTNYTADPAPMVYKDRVYLFTSHDDDVTEADFYTMRNYCCYSSKDIVNWTDHGIVATLKEFKWITVNNGAWAPQCVERDGKFFLYIPIQGKGMGVLVADSPAGPFKDPIDKALINRGNWSDIDPTVFVDSDGQAYLYWGNGTLWYVKLNNTMTSYAGSIVTTNPKPSSFTEGPWFYKRNDLYYMAYAGMGGGNENLQYATSTSPTGPWTSKGIIMPSGNCFTNHPGICEFGGNAYLFYHNANLPGGGTFKRSVCIEKFTYGNDGAIPAVSQTKEGPAQVGSLDPYDTVQAETICWESGVRTQPCGEGGINVDSIHNGDYIKVKGVDFGPGAKSFDARVASGGSGGSIELRLGSQTGTLVGTCSVAGTGGWQTWETKTCSVSGASGKQDLFLKFTGSGGLLFNFNWWKFTPAVKTMPSRMPTDVPGKHVRIAAGAGCIKLDFPQPVSRGVVNVSLFGLNGRLMRTLFNGSLTSSCLIFPVGSAGFRTGTCLIKVSLDDKNVLINKAVL